MNLPNQWREIFPPQKPPVPEMRIDGPDLSHVSVETSNADPSRWWLYLSCSSGEHAPRIEGEPHPLGAALDFAIRHCEEVLVWLRAVSADIAKAEKQGRRE